jgi:hypothetical protein
MFQGDLVNSAILSLVGLVVGAVLQFLFTKHLDNKKHQRDVRSKAYADYLLCVSKQANMGHQRQSNEGRQLNADTADAKCRISLYGAPPVVTAFAKFDRLGATINTDEQCRAFTDMVLAMRQDALGGALVDPSDLEVVLLGARRAT